jgi:hypothetical protein
MFYANLSTIPAALLIACAFIGGAEQTGPVTAAQPNGDLSTHQKRLGRLPAELVKAKKGDTEIVKELYKASLNRVPDDSERAAYTKLLGAAKDRTEKSRSILFLLVSSREFQKLHNLDPAEAVRLINEMTADWEGMRDAKEPDQKKKSDQ